MNNKDVLRWFFNLEKKEINRLVLLKIGKYKKIKDIKKEDLYLLLFSLYDGDVDDILNESWSKQKILSDRSVINYLELLEDYDILREDGLCEPRIEDFLWDYFKK
jgi:hypothetical protein